MCTTFAMGCVLSCMSPDWCWLTKCDSNFEISERHFDKRPTRFVSFAASGHSTASAKKDTWSHFEGSVTPTWEFYQSAAEESMPIYHVVSRKTFHKRPGPVPILNQKREFIANGVM